MLALVALVVAVWLWAGSAGSLAALLARVALHLPAGQTLESHDVHGSVRRGGRIGSLRWSNGRLAVELHDARIGWQLRPLLSRQVRLGEVHAAAIDIYRTAPPDESPTEPPQRLTLPVEVDLPFSADVVRWHGPPAVELRQLAGHYAYAAGEHRLDIARLDWEQGRYDARLRLQGAAPMALEAVLNARLRTPVPGSEATVEVQGSATVRGPLAGAGATLALQAALRQQPAADDTAAPVTLDLAATVQPWAPQPLRTADARFAALDLARLWPTLPATLLDGRVQATPDAGGLAVQAEVRNARPGPWDRGQLPLQALDARARQESAGAWVVEDATASAGGGLVRLQGHYAPGEPAAAPGAGGTASAATTTTAPDAAPAAAPPAPEGGEERAKS